MSDVGLLENANEKQGEQGNPNSKKKRAVGLVHKHLFPCQNEDLMLPETMCWMHKAHL